MVTACGDSNYMYVCIIILNDNSCDNLQHRALSLAFFTSVRQHRIKSYVDSNIGKIISDVRVHKTQYFDIRCVWKCIN